MLYGMVVCHSYKQQGHTTNSSVKIGCTDVHYSQSRFSMCINIGPISQYCYLLVLYEFSTPMVSATTKFQLIAEKQCRGDGKTLANTCSCLFTQSLRTLYSNYYQQIGSLLFCAVLRAQRSCNNRNFSSIMFNKERVPIHVELFTLASHSYVTVISTTQSMKRL